MRPMQRIPRIVALALVLAGCGPATDGNSARDWGPLAVDDSQEAGEALMRGTINITDDCVILDEESGGEVLLVWPADRTRWDPSSRSITVQNFNGALNTFSDGNHLLIGGGASSAHEGGQSSSEWIASIEWVAEPRDACLRDVRWFVGEIQIPQ
jgi:hypothetical protein